MIRQFIGLLMIFVILFPLLVGATGIVVTHDIVVQVQTKWQGRIDHIQAQMNEVETTVNTVTQRFQALQTVANQIASSANEAAQTVVDTINNFKIHIGGVHFPSILGVKLPDIPAADITIPGLSNVRDFLQNLYNSLASLTQAISDVTLIAQVPGQIGQIVTEAQGFPNDVIQIVGPYGQTLLIVAIGILVWMAAIYVVLVYTWLVRGWAMLMGRPVPA